MMLLATEEEAKTWLVGAFPSVPRETWRSVDAFARMLVTESGTQNLISPRTLDQLWVRHIADSAQLACLAPTAPIRWLDVGTGAGFPGLVVAALTGHFVTLAEPRKLRVDFLRRAASLLGVGDRVAIAGTPLEQLPISTFDIISARAFAPLQRLLPLAHRFSTENTRWILPKGRSAQSELDQISATWQGRFRLEPSLTDPQARIIVADHVHPLPTRRQSS